jgi:FdhD protein
MARQIRGQIPLPDDIEKVEILRINSGGSEEKLEDRVIVESPLTIMLNGQELVTLLCSPVNARFLGIGYLFSEGLIQGKDEIKLINLDDRRGVVRIDTFEEKNQLTDEVFKRVITTGCGRGVSFYSFDDLQHEFKAESKVKYRAETIFGLLKEFQELSETFKMTGGVHSAALCNTEKILFYASDVGRHNAIDAIIGRCVMEEIPAEDGMIITSGRISSEILIKVARKSIPLLVSRAAPTNVGVKLAKQIGMTLIGFARGQRMNIYCNDWRVERGAGS